MQRNKGKRGIRKQFVPVTGNAMTKEIDIHFNTRRVSSKLSTKLKLINTDFHPNATNVLFRNS